SFPESFSEAFLHLGVEHVANVFDLVTANALRTGDGAPPDAGRYPLVPHRSLLAHVGDPLGLARFGEATEVVVTRLDLAGRLGAALPHLGSHPRGARFRLTPVL